MAKPRKKGFTFIELLVALSLFAVGMLSVLQIFPINRRYLKQSAMTTQAAFLAQEELEILQADSYSSLVVGTSPYHEPRHAMSMDPDNPYAQFERQTEVVLINPQDYQVSGTDLGMKKVTATIYWQEDRISRQYSLSTYVYNH